MFYVVVLFDPQGLALGLGNRRCSHRPAGPLVQVSLISFDGERTHQVAVIPHPSAESSQWLTWEGREQLTEAGADFLFYRICLLMINTEIPPSITDCYKGLSHNLRRARSRFNSNVCVNSLSWLVSITLPVQTLHAREGLHAEGVCSPLPEKSASWREYWGRFPRMHSSGKWGYSREGDSISLSSHFISNHWFLPLRLPTSFPSHLSFFFFLNYQRYGQTTHLINLNFSSFSICISPPLVGMLMIWEMSKIWVLIDKRKKWCGDHIN